MERDFLGLNCKDSRKLVKEKTKDIRKNSVTGVQWSLANKKFSLPHLVPFKAAQEDEQRKIVHNSLTSSIFLPVLTGCAFDCYSEPPLCLAKLSNSPTGGSKDHFQSETIEYLRSRDKSSGALAQMTIFYADDVHVYDNISPEKAEAIMCFAGNGSSMRANTKKSSKPIGDNYRNQAQPPQIFNTRQSIAATFVEGAMPEARRASLARFLEKRKDRLKHAMPYSLVEKLLDCSNPQFSNISSFAQQQQRAVAVSGSDVGGTAQI